MFNLLGKVLGFAVDKIFPDRSKVNEAQSRINEAEVAGAPATILRSWRGFLGWILSLCFAWEVAGRLIIIPMFFDVWGQSLPPSALDKISMLLIGMLGMG